MTLYILLSPQVSSYLAPGQLELILGHPPPGSRYSRGLSPAADTLCAGSVLYCTVLYCAVLCCTVLYCTIPTQQPILYEPCLQQTISTSPSTVQMFQLKT